MTEYRKSTDRWTSAILLIQRDGYVSPGTLAEVEGCSPGAAAEWLKKRVQCGELEAIQRGRYVIGSIKPRVGPAAHSMTDDDILALYRCADEPRSLEGEDGLIELLDVNHSVCASIVKLLAGRSMLEKLESGRWQTTDSGMAALALYERQAAMGVE